MSKNPANQHARGLHLMQAIEDATGFLAIGIAQVTTPGWQARAGQPALQTLATGVEKLSKLTIGMMIEDETGTFPSQKALKKWGHDIKGLVSSLDYQIEGRASQEARPYILRLKDALDVDPYWLGLLEALNVAADAKSGRYIHESALGGSPSTNRPIGELWHELDSKAIERLGLATAIAGPDAREALCRIRTEIVVAAVRWWHLVFRVWQHGLAGPSARRLSTDVRIQWDTLPPSLEALAKSL